MENLFLIFFGIAFFVSLCISVEMIWIGRTGKKQKRSWSDLRVYIFLSLISIAGIALILVLCWRNNFFLEL